MHLWAKEMQFNKNMQHYSKDSEHMCIIKHKSKIRLTDPKSMDIVEPLPLSTNIRFSHYW